MNYFNSRGLLFEFLAFLFFSMSSWASSPRTVFPEGRRKANAGAGEPAGSCACMVANWVFIEGLTHTVKGFLAGGNEPVLLDVVTCPESALVKAEKCKGYIAGSIFGFKDQCRAGHSASRGRYGKAGRG